MPNSDEKRIRFIDSNYNDLFTLPDGGTLYLRYADGEKQERSCKYIDDYHLMCGSNVLHICQLAELMERNKTQYAPIPLPDKMPYRCYSIVPSSGELVLLKYGETGYFKCNYSTRSFDKNEEYAEKLNQIIGVNAAQAAAMQGGSMFGWDKPIANPNNYTEDGSMRKINRYESSFAERMRKAYPEGTKIVLDEMNDPYRKDMVSGMKGIVQRIDDIGTLHCIWQDGSTLGVIPGEDKFHIDTENENEPDIETEEQSDELEL